MKSAYELAMERLEKEQGRLAPLSDRQKEALAEIDRRLQASLAEVEITFNEKRAAASAKGDYAAAAEIEEQRRREAVRLRDRAESEKEAVRRDPSLA